MSSGDLPITARSGESFTVTWQHTVKAQEDDMITDSDEITWVYRDGEWQRVTFPAGDREEWRP